MTSTEKREALEEEKEEEVAGGKKAGRSELLSELEGGRRVPLVGNIQNR